MHNLKDLRKNIKEIKRQFEERNVIFDVDQFVELDKSNRDLINKRELLEQEKDLSKSKDKSNFEKSKELSKINEITLNQKNIQEKLNKIIFNLPNLPVKGVPIGKSEKDNKLIRKVGEVKKFDFKIKSHVELSSKRWY